MLGPFQGRITALKRPRRALLGSEPTRPKQRTRIRIEQIGDCEAVFVGSAESDHICREIDYHENDKHLLDTFLSQRFTFRIVRDDDSERVLTSLGVGYGIKSAYIVDDKYADDFRRWLGLRQIETN